MRDDDYPLFPAPDSDLEGLLTERETEGHASSLAGSVLAFVPTTMVIPSTITAGPTILSTEFVTITTTVPRTLAPSTAVDSDATTTQTTRSHTTLPAIVTPSHPVDTTFKTSSRNAHHTAATDSDGKIAAASSMSSIQKRAIIGGLSGTIAGLVLIGVLLCVFFKRRHSRDDRSQVGSGSSLKQTISRSWSQLTGSNGTLRTPPVSSSSATLPPMPPMSRQSSAAEFNGSLLRVSMGGWPRPFAHGESFRETAGPGRLMVMNPDDPSRSTTPAPRGSMESGGTYLKRQRTAISAKRFGGYRSRASSNAPSRQYSVKVPPVKVESALSSDSIPRSTLAPSFRSYPSANSVHTVQQQPPEDPFLTPPEGSLEEDRPKLLRPGLATIQHAAGAAGRSLSSFGRALNPIRSKSNVVENVEDQRNSDTTFSSAGDPFRLRCSIGESEEVVEETGPRPARPAHLRPFPLYDGT